MFRVPYFEDEMVFAQIFSPEHHKFTRQTSDSFCRMPDDLAIFSSPALNAVLETREMAYGLTYEPTEFLWCRQVRHHLHFPYVVYWDHMHCLTASGGIAQYIVSQMVLGLLAQDHRARLSAQDHRTPGSSVCPGSAGYARN